MLLRIALFLTIISPVFAQNDTTLVVKAISGMQYDPPRIQVKPRSQVTLVFENYDDMAHNLVITKPDARLMVVEQALKVPSEKNYVPETPMVVAATKVVIPGTNERITFRVEEGVYSYVCTYPGHGFVMYGALYASGELLPPLEKDPNVASLIKEKRSEHQESPHAFPIQYPMLYRTWVPGASPAAIVVSFDGNTSYCWDAGQCRLRYAWTGGFVDNEEQWYSKGDKYSKIIGEVFWREDSLNYPIRLGKVDHIPTVKFLGYTLKNHLPTFRYLVDDVEIHETLKPVTGEMAITRQFVVVRNPAKKKIFYQPSQGDKTITYRPENLVLHENNPAVYALKTGLKSFTITIAR
ncbi:MAG: plastocyanin/azurin family copper-binding protein [Siphonobacter sp.]